ncbi:MAG: TGS domain-containing protein, partial [Anaerolineae bacterium]
VPENIYTVYQDLLKTGVSFDEVDATPRLAVIVDDWQSCYLALGHLHHLWKPVPGSFDDYIAFPRENLYRSLHTTVLHNTGRQVKLRFRTAAMNSVSEIGVLARWLYAGAQFWTSDVSQRVEAFLENISGAISLEPHNPTVGVKGVVEDALTKQIRVHTPHGDVVELPMGATPIDFAYAIHTGLGDQCHSAYVNDSLYPLNKPLRDGDTVRIVKKLRAQPQRAWLDRDLGYIATQYAHYHASRWFRRLSEDTAVRQGHDLLQSELKMIGYPEYLHKDISDALDYPTTTALYHDLGRAELLPTVVATRILVDHWDKAPIRDLDNVVYVSQDEKLVVTGVKNRRLRLCSTCNPHVRDPIIGYIRADQSVTVHRQNCRALVRERLPGRILKLGWGETATRRVRLITIQVDVYDRPGLLFEITQLMEEKHVNIAYINTPPAKKGEMYLIISLEIMNPRQLVRILHQIQALTNVFAVRRLYEGTPDDPIARSSGLYLPE